MIIMLCSSRERKISVKRFFSFMLFGTLLVSSCSVAFAAYDIENSLDEAEKYAYMDIDKAPDYLQDDILEARNQIIFSQGWTADGINGYVCDLETGEKLYDLPKFSELFPDWDIPKMKDTISDDLQSRVEMERVTDPSEGKLLSITPRKLDTLIYKNVYLRSPSSSADTSNFATYKNFLGGGITAGPNQLYASETANVGISNASTGESLGYKNYLYPGQGVHVSIPYTYGRFNVGLRASTYSTPGYADMIGSYDLAEELK